jgi:hypothetical protein
MTIRPGTFILNQADSIYAKLALAYMGNAAAVNDSGPNGYAGTPVGSPSWAVDSTIGRNAINLNGSTQYVTIGNRAALQGHANWTLSCWVKVTDVAAPRPVFNGMTDNSNKWTVMAENFPPAKIYCGGTTAGTSCGSPANTATLATWQHWLWTYSSASGDDQYRVVTYLNGTRLNAGDASSILWGIVGATMYWGRYYNPSSGSQNWFKGSLADLVVLNAVATAAEIARLCTTDPMLGGLIIGPRVRAATYRMRVN